MDRVIFDRQFAMTAPQAYLWEFNEIPPKELQYDGWETDVIVDTYNNKYIDFIHFWISVKTIPLPKELLCYCDMQ